MEEKPENELQLLSANLIKNSKKKYHNKERKLSIIEELDDKKPEEKRKEDKKIDDKKNLARNYFACLECLLCCSHHSFKQAFRHRGMHFGDPYCE
mgnify:CR=1 FL=1